MSKKDWYSLGEDLRDIVQSAVDTQDFDRLNQTISSAINSALKGVQDGLREAGVIIEESGRREENEGRQRSGRSRSTNGSGSTGESQRTNDSRGAGRASSKASGLRRSSELFAGVSGSRTCGAVLMGIGLCCSVVTGILLLLLVMSLLVSGWFYGAEVGLTLFGILFGGNVVMAWKGSALFSMTKRFDRYIRGLRGRTYADVKQLAAEIGKSDGYVRKDLKRMIGKGWFLEGHLDEQETCLMVTDQIYEEYLSTKRRSEELRIQRQEEEKEAAENGLSLELKAVMEEGNAYIQRIRKSNDEIPGEEISEKISRMELIVRRIFERVEQHPENIPDIRRMMEYYLPTTVKLLGAYEELDRQPVQGENILQSKKEIEDTLDTLNLAFEKLLDGLFRDTAWDVSTDISVLQTMLAQEGLTKDDF